MKPEMPAAGKSKVETMFDSIAPDYDSLNHILSMGVDRAWRRLALKEITDKDSSLAILDAACGTGDFSIAIAKASSPRTRITGVDLSEGMLKVMARKVERSALGSMISAEKGDCTSLDVPEGTFDRVAIAFGIRNFARREAALKEFLRVLKPGGKLVVLELGMPRRKFIRWCYNLYFSYVLPFVGGLVSGDRAAYRYLPASVKAFPPPGEWIGTMSSCGFVSVTCRSFSFGICNLFTGEKT